METLKRSINSLIPSKYSRFCPYSILCTELLTSHNFDDVMQQPTNNTLNSEIIQMHFDISGLVTSSNVIRFGAYVTEKLKMVSLKSIRWTVVSKIGLRIEREGELKG